MEENKDFFWVVLGGRMCGDLFFLGRDFLGSEMEGIRFWGFWDDLEFFGVFLGKEIVVWFTFSNVLVFGFSLFLFDFFNIFKIIQCFVFYCIFLNDFFDWFFDCFIFFHNFCLHLDCLNVFFLYSLYNENRKYCYYLWLYFCKIYWRLLIYNRNIICFYTFTKVMSITLF